MTEGGNPDFAHWTTWKMWNKRQGAKRQTANGKHQTALTGSILYNKKLVASAIFLICMKTWSSHRFSLRIWSYYDAMWSSRPVSTDGQRMQALCSNRGSKTTTRAARLGKQNFLCSTCFLYFFASTAFCTFKPFCRYGWTVLASQTDTKKVNIVYSSHPESTYVNRMFQR